MSFHTLKMPLIFPMFLTVKMCEMFRVKDKPRINPDTVFFVWQSANVMNVAGQRAMSLLLQRGAGEGLREKKALLIPTTAVLLWYHDQAVFVFRVGRDIFVFVYLCECVCVKACAEGCVGGCTADMLIQGRRQGRGRVTMSNLTELRWRGMKSVCLWRSYVTNLTTCLSVYHELLQIADI